MLKKIPWSPSPGLGGPPRGMLRNRPRAEMGFLPALMIAEGIDLAPWIFWTLVGGGAAYGGSVLFRNEAEKWKQAIGINLDHLPYAILSGGAGAIAITVGGALDGTGKAVATAVGIAGLTGSLYLLFSGTPALPSGNAAAVPSGGAKAPLSVPAATVPPDQVAPSLAPGPLSRALTVSFPPTQPDTGGTHRNLFKDQDWEFVVRNETDATISFYTGVSIYDEGSKLIWRSPAVDPVYGRNMVTVAAGLSVSGIQKSEDLGWGIVTYGAVQIDLFRQRDDATPFMSSQAIPITFGLLV